MFHHQKGMFSPPGAATADLAGLPRAALHCEAAHPHGGEGALIWKEIPRKSLGKP